MALTPRSGSTSTVGPVAAFSCSAMRRPISTHSSARRAHQRDRRVVPVEVAVPESLAARSRCRRSSPCRARRPTPPAECRAAGRRQPVGPAVSTPPTTSSHHSVVVTSTTPGEVAVVDEPFHRAAAGARGVEHEHVVAGALPGARARPSRTASSRRTSSRRGAADSRLPPPDSRQCPCPRPCRRSRRPRWRGCGATAGSGPRCRRPSTSA